MKFKNQWAIILGGSSGLGLGSAKKLASHGMNLCLVHRDRKARLPQFLAEVEAMRAHGVDVLTFNQDALKAETREEILTALTGKNIKLLLHSIAKGNLKPMVPKKGEALTREDLNITLDAMGLSLYDWVRSLIDRNLFTNDARIIAFTSEGNTKAWPSYAAVSAAKAVLEALIRNMALEFAPFGITANCIQAGATRTPSFEAIPGSDQIASAAERRNPFKRLTTPQDVADVVYLMCLPEAKWINGDVIKVDGGEHLS